MIDETIVLLNKEKSGNRAKKFVSLMRKLRETTDAYDEIMCFLLLLSRIDDNYAGKSQVETSSRCSGSEILNAWKQTVNNYLPISAISENHTSCYEDGDDVMVQHQPCRRREKTVPIDINLSKSAESYEKIRRMIVDERGRIQPRACDPELRSLCKLKIGDMFYIISWHEYLRCIAHVLMGEESILFRKNAVGFFNFFEKNKMFLELEDINLLPRLALPFLKFANRLFYLEQFLCGSDSVKNSSMFCKIRKNTATRALLTLKLCASEQLWKFRDKVRHHANGKEECDSENIRRLLRELLDMCNVFSHFVDIVLYIQTIDARNINTLLNIFYIVKITKGRIIPAIREFCDDVLVALLRHYAECMLFWLIKGEANPSDGIFSFSKVDAETLRDTISGENESVGLEISMLITKNFLDVWLSEGKFRKLIFCCQNLKQLTSEEPKNYVTVNKLINDLSQEEIRKALDSNSLGAVESLLDFYFQKVYLSQNAIFIRCCVIDDFKQTAKLLQDVYLCDDECITEIFMRVLSEGSGSELNSNLGNCQKLWLDEMMDYLLSKNYSSILVHGFSQLTSSFDEENDLKLCYKPQFPLNIIFAPSILMNYEYLELKMMVEKSCIYSIAMMQMRMWNFIRAIRYFFHEQIRCIIVNEYQKDCEKIISALSFGSEACEIMECVGGMFGTDYQISSLQCGIIQYIKII
ncbi:unnamed protein product [Onchocerca flexuosa]|uniref:Gamma-tubulin complex component n=1 Tax=Onchocerca flexuosa TaxID=387005 RepID=A0A183I1N6_9BILA|nr:unnamed protein product [Onchocerca flexuosa]